MVAFNTLLLLSDPSCYDNNNNIFLNLKYIPIGIILHNILYASHTVFYCCSEKILMCILFVRKNNGQYVDKTLKP